MSGARGRPPTPFLKVSGVYMDGMKVTGELFIGGQEAKQKVLYSRVFVYICCTIISQAESVGRAVAARAEKLVKKLGMDGYRGVEIETLGAEYTYG